METVCNKLEKSLVEVQVSFSKEEWKAAQKEALAKLAKNVKIDGFRKGKAPVQMVKARIGKGTILEEATDIILQKNYGPILLDNNIQPVGQPEVKITEMSEDVFNCTVTAPVAPEVKLGDYKDLEVKKTTVRVTKKEVEERIKEYQKQFAELVVKEEGEVETGDTVVIDYQGLKDGVAFDGGTAENYSLEIGSNTFIPGFEDQIIGMKANDEKDIELTFPKEYHAEDLAGQEVIFKVKVHEIKYKSLPEIDDELAKDVNIDGVETLEDLRTYTKEQIRIQKQTQSENDFSEKIYNALIENTSIDLPDAMVESEINMMLREIEQNLAQQGLNLETFQQITGKTTDDMKEEVREQAEKRVKFNLILAEIAKVENIEVSDDEVEEEIKEIASYYGKEVDEIKQIFGSQIDSIKADLASRKAVQFVKDNVKK